MEEQENIDSPEERPKIGGTIKANGKETGKVFTSENQPSSEAKKRGWNKKKTLKDLLNIVTTKNFDGSKLDYQQLTADYLGIDKSKVTILMVMQYRQLEKAIKNGDTYAFNSVCDRAFGKPKQEVGVTDKKGNDVALQKQVIVIGDKTIEF